VPTTSFPTIDNTKVTLGSRWANDGTKLTGATAGAHLMFSFVGTDLQINHSASGTAGCRVSIDGGAFTAVTTTSTTSKTLIDVAMGLSEGTHTAIIRVESAYVGTGFRIWNDDGIVVTGAAPEVLQYPNFDTLGRQIYGTNGIFQTSLISAPSTTSYNSPQQFNPLSKNGRIRFKTDAAKISFFPANVDRIYIDGFGEFEGPSTVAMDYWSQFELPNDGQMHEITAVTNATIYEVNYVGGTGVFKSDYADGCNQYRVALVGDSITAGDSGTGYSNSAASIDVLAEQGIPGRCTLFNRSASGDSITSYNSGGRTRLTVKIAEPDAIVFLLGANDGANNDAEEMTLKNRYVQAFIEAMRTCSRAVIYQFEGCPGLSPGARVQSAQATAVAEVAALFPNRSISVIPADPAWTYGPNSPTAGYTRSGLHPYPSGYCFGLGMNHASIVLSANPSGGDTITATIAGTERIFTFDAGSHGASPNPVTIGGSVGDTITTLKNVMLAVLGRPNLVAWTNNASAGYFVGVRNCTAITKSGTNVFAYRIDSGFLDMLEPLIPAAPTSGGGGLHIGGLGQTGIGVF
jgi:lysophospholipase L1-like esterase